MGEAKFKKSATVKRPVHHHTSQWREAATRPVSANSQSRWRGSWLADCLVGRTCGSGSWAAHRSPRGRARRRRSPLTL